MATEVTHVIDPDSGAGYDYASLNAWQSAQARDLVSADEIEIAKCRCTSGSADTTAVTINTWTTDSTHYVKIWTDPAETYRHDGKWDTTAYRLINNDTASHLDVQVPYIRFDGLQFSEETATGITTTFRIAGDDVNISNSISRNVSGTGTTVVHILDHYNLHFWNNIAYDYTESHGAVYDEYNYTGHLFYNNTIINSTNAGFYVFDNSVLKNNLAQGNGTDFYTGNSWNSSCCNNASSDGTAPGTDSRTNQTFTFVDATNDDYHLSSTDTGAKDYGTDLSSDSNLSFTDDIDGDTRTSPWDIGADEYVSAAFKTFWAKSSTATIGEVG